MANAKMMTEAEVRDIAHKSFLLGVDWICKTLMDCEIFDFTQQEADLFRKKAERVLGI